MKKFLGLTFYLMFINNPKQQSEVDITRLLKYVQNYFDLFGFNLHCLGVMSLNRSCG